MKITVGFAIKVFLSGGLWGYVMSTIFDQPLSYILSFIGGLGIGITFALIKVKKQNKESKP